MKIFTNTFLCVLLAVLTICQSGYAKNEDEQEAQQQSAGAFPETDIFLFDFNPQSDDAVLSNPVNISDRTGYDNQPFFTAAGDSILYSRSNGNQTDIYEYILSTAVHNRLTHSETSEFSPTPASDSKSISFVSERNSSIWQAERGNEDDPRWVFQESGMQEPVGYFARNVENGNILFWSRYGYSVSLINSENGTYHYVSGNAVPATPHLIPGSNNFSFVHRQANESVWIKELNPETRAIRPLTPIVASNANYAWTPDGAIVQIEGTIVYSWQEKSESEWRVIADLSEYGIKSANRIAVSPDGKKIAVVGLAVAE